MSVSVDKNTINIIIDSIVDDTEKILALMAKDGVEYMRQYIISNTKRQPSENLLAKSIDYFKIDDNSYGIGKISDLPEYWYVINYGKMFDGGNFYPGGGKSPKEQRGNFNGEMPLPRFAGVPGGGGAKFSVSSPYFTMTANNYVNPMNYIESTLSYLKSKYKR